MKFQKKHNGPLKSWQPCFSLCVSRLQCCQIWGNCARSGVFGTCLAHFEVPWRNAPDWGILKVFEKLIFHLNKSSKILIQALDISRFGPEGRKILRIAHKILKIWRFLVKNFWQHWWIGVLGVLGS